MLQVDNVIDSVDNIDGVDDIDNVVPLRATRDLAAAERAAAAGGTIAAERQLPVPVIVAHGLLAVVTLVLVLLATAGGS